MMRTSSAYPKLPNRQFLKLAAIVAAAVLVVLALWSGSTTVPGPEVGGSSLRSGRVTSAKLSALIGVGIGLTEQAAEEIKQVKFAHAEDLKVKGHTKEGVAEPVTVADTNSNEVFVNGYRNHFNGIKILSEETEPDNADTKVNNPVLPVGLQLEMDPDLDMKDVLIIVDPLDATKEFGEDLLNYVTTMVCIVYKGEPIAGIINQVFEDDKPPVVGVIPLKPEDKGVLFNRVKKTAEGDAAHKVAISRSHTGEGGNVVEKYLEGHSPLLAGGAGYKALLVVDGETEGYVHVTAIKSWDVCAAEAVMKASGGDFTDIEGHSLEYPMEYDSEHSQALFKNGIVAAQTQEQHKYFVSKLDGHLQ